MIFRQSITLVALLVGALAGNAHGETQLRGNPTLEDGWGHTDCHKNSDCASMKSTFGRTYYCKPSRAAYIKKGSKCEKCPLTSCTQKITDAKGKYEACHAACEDAVPKIA
mmetsp:Transcript_35960/g.86814  ORF Transcript_35960/g.86814 Transcript_35960/m.86814 type:complete len:110 (+) Transcript_35960:110-439(+)